MTNRPRLYPGHQHEWTDLPAWHDKPDTVRCDVCGFEVPRTVAGQPPAPPLSPSEG